MWFVKGFLFLLLLFFLAYFFIVNSGQTVDLNFFGQSFLGISIYWVVLASCLVGFLASFIMAMFREFRLRSQLRRLQKVMRGQEKEIAELRTLPLRSDDRNTAGDDDNRTESGHA